MNVLETHIRPVNFQAAKIFWKAPWWAKLMQEDKEELIRTQTKIEDLVDVFRAPPKRPGGPKNQIEDVRGFKVKHKQKGLVALVLGYAYSKPRPSGFKDATLRFWNEHSWCEQQVRIKRQSNAQRWYAFFGGEVQVILLSHWKIAGNYEAISPVTTNFNNDQKH